MQRYHTKNNMLRLLQIAVCCVFVGRAWQHLVWDAPFRTLLWDESWMRWIVESIFNTTWQDYITSPEVDSGIQATIKGFGYFYLICALMSLMIRKWSKISGIFMVLGSISLVALAFLYCKERFFSAGQFLEYSLQFSSPLFLYCFASQLTINKRLLYWMKLTIAFTFVCHGLYAIGYYPRPGYFTEMTMLILGISESAAITFLKIAGVLDFIIGIGIFLPSRIAKWVVLYAIFWGVLTTLARITAYVEFAYFLETAKQWVHESVYRVPHFVIPLVVFLKMWKSDAVVKLPNHKSEPHFRSEQVTT